MQRVLVPVDGSEHSHEAIRFVIAMSAAFKSAPEIHLLNVQHPLPGTIKGVAELARQFHQEEGAAALAVARKLLDEAGMAHQWHISVGDVAASIRQVVTERGCDHVVMGTRGMGSVRNMLLGSVATKVLHVLDVPVTLVK